MTNSTQPNKGRTADRRRVLKSGVIAYNGRHVTMTCGVRDFSASGARLLVQGSMTAPDTFELMIELDGLEAPCEVVWRRGQEVGVRFTAPPQPAAKKREQVVSQWADTRQKPTLRRKPALVAGRTRA